MLWRNSLSKYYLKGIYNADESMNYSTKVWQNMPTQIREVLRWWVKQSLAWQQRLLLEIRHQYLLQLEKPKNPAALRTKSFYLPDIDIKKSGMDGVLFEDWVQELDWLFEKCPNTELSLVRIFLCSEQK